ncbi:unnamed protein product, partial [Lampetra planeri]
MVSLPIEQHSKSDQHPAEAELKVPQNVDGEDDGKAHPAEDVQCVSARLQETVIAGKKADSRHPTCNFLLEVEKDHTECLRRLKEDEESSGPREPGCKGKWDNITCWQWTEVGQTVTIPCPRVLKTVFGRNGNISRNCTSAGWSEVFPNLTSVCGSDTSQDKLIFYVVVQTLYTLGHSLSLIALTTGSAILCLVRKLHCTRNYIHLNLFISFIPKSRGGVGERRHPLQQNLAVLQPAIA